MVLLWRLPHASVGPCSAFFILITGAGVKSNPVPEIFYLLNCRMPRQPIQASWKRVTAHQVRIMEIDWRLPPAMLGFRIEPDRLRNESSVSRPSQTAPGSSFQCSIPPPGGGFQGTHARVADENQLVVVAVTVETSRVGMRSSWRRRLSSTRP